MIGDSTATEEVRGFPVRTAAVLLDGARLRQRVVVAPRICGWRDSAVHQLNLLVGLKKGWDGYSADPVSFACAHFALQLLEAICSDEAPLPHMVPGTSGDLQIEWHLSTGDIELHVRAPNRVEAWRSFTGVDGEGEVRFLTSDFTLVAHWLADLERANRAAVSAAA